MKHFTIENETNNIMVHATAQEAEALANAERFRNEAGLAKLAADWPMARLVEIYNSLPGAEPVKKFKDRGTGVGRIWKAIQTLGGAELETGQPEAEHVAPEPAAHEVAEATTATTVEQQGADVAPAEPAPGDEAIRPETPAETAPIDTAKCIELLQIAASTQGAFWDAARSLEEAIGFDVDATRDLGEATIEELIGENAARQRRKSAAHAPRENSKTSQVIAMLRREGGTTLEEIMDAMKWQKHTTRAMLSAGGSLIKKHGLVVTSAMVGEKRVYSIKA